MRHRANLKEAEANLNASQSVTQRIKESYGPTKLAFLTWRMEWQLESPALTRTQAREISPEQQGCFTSTPRRLTAGRPTKQKSRAKSALQTKLDFSKVDYQDLIFWQADVCAEKC